VQRQRCTGCPNPQIYGTPRTTPVGKVQHTVAVEGLGYSIKYPTRTASTGESITPPSSSGTLPNLPTYALRVGVADRVDIGARVSNLTSIGADVKWNFIKGDVFDMAAVPGFQVFHISATGGNGETAGYTQFYVNLPLVFGINISDAVTVVPTAGVTWGLNSASVVADDDTKAASSVDGIMLRGGLGFNFRISPKFAMQPEITVLKFNKSEDASVLLYTFGLGFNFGALPVYGAPEPAEQ
jgi:hypothetical protein